MEDKTLYFDLKGLSKRAGISKNALGRRAARANRSDLGELALPGVGNFVVRKKGKKEWRFVPLVIVEAPDMIKREDAKAEMVKLLKDLSGYVCQDCVSLVGQVLENV